MARYRAHLSGPLLDRIDLHVEVPRVEAAALQDERPGESTEAVRKRVMAARRLQTHRYRGSAFALNGELSGPAASRLCRVTAPALRLLSQAVDRLGLSARAHQRVVKVARTLADLDGEAQVSESRLAEALSFRALDRPVEAPPR